MFRHFMYKRKKKTAKMFTDTWKVQKKKTAQNVQTLGRYKRKRQHKMFRHLEHARKKKKYAHSIFTHKKEGSFLWGIKQN